MAERYMEIESQLWGVLPKSGEKANPEISKLTKELIAAGGDSWNIVGYTHSVCHLFEKYGYGEGSRSYLNSSDLFPVADKLVNYTLARAMKGRDFGCVDRIVSPISSLNLAHLEDDWKKFVFKPEILSNPEFIEAFDKSSKREYVGQSVDFCRSKNPKGFFKAYVKLLRERDKVDLTKEIGTVVSGVFIDVEGTLLTYKGYDSNQKLIVEKDSSVEKYALRKIKEGVPVTVFTGGNPKELGERLRKVELDERLLDVKSKAEFLGSILEVCVDDTVPTMQGFRAKKHYQSGEAAWKAEYSR